MSNPNNQNNNKKENPKKSNFGSISFYVLFFVIFLVVATYLNNAGGPDKNYTDLFNAIRAGDVAELSLAENRATVQLQNGQRWTVNIPSLGAFYNDMGEMVVQQMEAGTLTVISQNTGTPWWFAALPTILTVGFIIMFWIMMQRMHGGGGKGSSFGRSKAKLTEKEHKTVNFKDVAGADECKEELEEVVEFLKQPKKFTDLGARIPRGVLLVGPPGTGKTLLAKAVAGEAGVPFFSISGSDFVEMFVGVGASRVRDLFDQAKKQSPSIIFIDEIDAVGRQRGAGMGGGHDEREQTLNQLLVEMDGFGANVGVIIIAATNRPDILDPALLRPGRFDRQITVNIPDVLGREEILHVHTAKKPLNEDVDLKVLAKTTTGFSGADLENLANEAALLAARKDRRKIHMQDFEDSIIKVIAGPEKKARVITEKERRLTAFHEAGHAIIARLMPTAHPVHQISIIPRGSMGGYTLSLPKEDRSYKSKTEMEEYIAVCLGGRVAEKIVLDDISTGASNDIQQATRVARSMVTKYGMSDKLGMIAFHDANDEVFLGRGLAQTQNYSETVATQIDSEIKRIIDEAYKRCEELLVENRKRLDAVAEKLLETEKIDADEFEEIFKAN